MKIKMNQEPSCGRGHVASAVLLAALFVSLSGYGQIGKVVQENKHIVGSSGDSKLELPFIEYYEVTDKPPYYTLWYWDDSKSERKIKSLKFHATDMELDYLYKVLNEGYDISMQRIEIGECRLVTRQPLRSENPLKINIYYPDDSVGTFYLKKSDLELLLGQDRNHYKKGDLAGAME
jgi:hypothetical protein